MRSRRMPLWAKRPMELKAMPHTRVPLRTWSLTSSTSETVCREKSTTALATWPSRRMERSWMAVRRMAVGPIPGTVGRLPDWRGRTKLITESPEPTRAKVMMLGNQNPFDGQRMIFGGFEAIVEA